MVRGCSVDFHFIETNTSTMPYSRSSFQYKYLTFLQIVYLLELYYSDMIVIAVRVSISIDTVLSSMWLETLYDVDLICCLVYLLKT